MAEFTDSVVGNEGQVTDAGFQVEATDGGSLSLPDGFSLSDANFETDGSDLVLTNEDGAQVTVEGFFSQDNPPDLVSTDGAQISGEMATQLSGGGEEVSAGTDSDAPTGGGMVADNPNIITGTDGEPIGNVENMSGTVFAVRTDGTRVELKEGDPVYQGDIVESSDDGAVGILLADETTFSMAENGRIVLDEMVYDPATQEGSVNLSAIQGVFTFVSGQVAKTDPDAMTLDTPVATIGIRGTQVGLNVEPEGGGMNIVLMEEADGFVGEVVIANNGGVQVINGANQTTSVANFSTAPTAIRVMDREELVSSFGNALKQLPKVHGNQNDFGLQDEGEGEEGEEGEEEEEGALDEEVEELEEGEQTAEELEEFETAAGEEEGEGEGEGEGDEIIEGDELDLAAAAEAQAAADALAAAEAASKAAADALAAEIAAKLAADQATKDAADAAAKAAEAAARAAADAARRAAETAAGAQAQASAGQARDIAETARDFAQFAAELSGKANIEDADIQELGRFAIGTDALTALNVVFEEAKAAADAAMDAAAAAADAVEAAKAAQLAADGAVGPASFGARDAAASALQDAQLALAAAEAARDQAEDNLLALTEEGGLIDAAEQAVADSDWLGTDGDDFMDVGDLNITGQTIDGGAGDDLINARGGDDVLLGGEGSDILIGGEGADVLDGGADFDIASYADALQGVMVDLASGTGTGGDAEGDTLVNIEGVLGSSFDDTLIGDSGDNLLIGGLGSDVIIGGEGTDTSVIVGDFGDYTIARADDGTITVTAPEIDGVSGDVDTLSGIEIIRFVDETVNVLDATVNEDTAVSVDVVGALGDVTEAASITIAGAPDGAVLNLADGTEVLRNDDGSWTLSPDQVTGLTVTPALNSDEDFSLTVSETDADGNQSGLGFVDIDVKGIADAANLDVDANADGAPSGELGATSIALDITAGLTDTDDSETLSITITGVPEGATLSSGTYDATTDTWTVSQTDLASLSVDSVDGISSDFTLTVTATTTEIDGGDTTSVSGTIPVNIGEDNIPDAPTLDLDSLATGDQNVGATTGDEDDAIQLDINAELTDETETLSITVGNIPLGAILILADGTELTPIDGEVELTQAQLADLSIRPPDDSDEDFDLTVTATSTTAAGESASTTGEITVTVDAVADAPTINDVTVTQGDPGGIIPMGISSEGAAEDPTPDDSSTHQVIGTDGDDHIHGESREEFIDGGAGNDEIFGSGGADVIVGGEGNDYVAGGGGADDIFGGTGDDILQGGRGSDEIYGGEGNDSLEGGEGADILSGGAGDDFIDGGRSHEGGEGEIHFHDGSSGDTVLFTGSRDQYMITENEDGSFTVVDMFAGRDGTDTVVRVENFQFSDGIVDEDDLLTTNPTTFIVDIDASLTDTDGSESLSLSVTGLPEGAYLTFGTEDPTGTWTFSADDYSAFTDAGGVLGVVVPYDVEADFQLSVTAISTEGDNQDSASTTMIIPIDGDASAPDLNVADVTGDEDTAIALDLSAALTDTDGSETLSITIEGVPGGAILAAGGVALVANADGTYTLSPDQLTGLTITPPTDSSDDFQLTVTATADESVDGSASTMGVINVTVDGVSDGATLDLNPDVDGDQLTGAVSGTEDTAIALDISGALNDESETASITISGVPAGATLSAGVEGPAGTWTLDPLVGDMDNLTITPALNSDEDFQLTVTVTTTDEADTTTVSGTIDVSVAADADAPTLSMTAASGTEDMAIDLDITSALTDADGSETLSITISGVPAGATLSAGTETPVGSGNWVLDPAAGDLNNLMITPPSNYSGEFSLSVTATSTDGGDLDNTATSSGNIVVSVAGAADAPDLDLDSTTEGDQLTGAASGAEDTAIALDISAALTDASETLGISITINGLPTGATLSAGTLNDDGSYTLTAEQLTGLTVTPAPDSDVDFTLAVTVTSTDGDDVATTSGLINVSVDPEADAPVLDLNPDVAGDQLTGTASGAEDTAIALDISAALSDTDGSETLGIAISGVPAGAVLSAGTFVTNENGTTTWTVTKAQLDGLTITPAADSSDDFTLSVGVASSEIGDNTSTESVVGTIAVSVAAVAGAPDVTADNVTGAEDTAITLNLSAASTDADDSETLSVSIGGVPGDASLALADGTPLTAAADGTYTLTPDQLTGLKLTPGDDFSGEIQLTMTTTVTDGSDELVTAPEAFTVTVTGVADAPDVTADNVTGAEDTAITLNLSAASTDADDSETLSVSIGGVPGDASLALADGTPLTAAADGTYTLTPDQLTGLKLTPGDDFSGEIQLTMTTTVTDGSDELVTAPEAFTVTVTGVADAPTLDLDSGTTGDQSVGTASGDEDTAITLDISSAVTDGSETLSITISGVPAGSTLSGGSEGPAGTWTLDPSAGDLNDLTMTPPAGFVGSIALAVIATALDGSTTADASGTIDVTVNPLVETDTTAEGATLSVNDATGFEDAAIALDISAALIDTDESETLSLTISNVPDGAILSSGTYETNEDGTTTWTVDGDDVDSLTITPPEDSNVDFDLTVTATTTETNGGATATTAPETISVGVTGVADAPTVYASIGNEVSYQDAVMDHEPIAYFQMNEGDDGNLVDSAGNNTATYHSGAESETDRGGIGDGTGDFDGRNDHIEVDHSSDMELSSGSITVWFNSDDVDDKQGLFSKDSSGYDNGGHLTAFVDDGTVKIRLQSGEDSYWVDGGSLTDNSWSQVTFNWGENGMELYVDGQLVDTNDYTGGIENNEEPLVIGANSWSSHDGEADRLKDYFDGQIDEFSMMSQPLSSEEVQTLYNTGGQDILDNEGDLNGTVTVGHSFELQIAGALADTDSSETLSVVVSGLPAGASLSAGVENDDGSWTLLSSDLSGLILNTDQTVNEDFDLTVTTVATEDELVNPDTATDMMTVHVDIESSDASVSLSGSSGDDVLVGGSGDDILKGRGGDDQLSGGAGDDVLFGSSGDDTLDGGSGADTMFGSSGRDVLRGGEGEDYLDGGSGNDVIDGGAGNDFIKGGKGDDVITGGAGNDHLEGGEGADTFMFDGESGHDIVTDILQQDVLVFEGEEFHMDDLVLSENDDGDVVVTFGGVEDTSVTLDGVSLDDLDANHDGDPSDGYSVSDDGSGVTITIDNV